jgi:DNA-binding FadR family transcriptional regulator
MPPTATGERLSEQVVRGMRALIESGSVSVGDKLPSEVSICDRYGVSRTVVREAIAQLRNEGLVTAKKGSGLFVAAPAVATQPAFAAVRPKSLADAIELLELRSSVERESAALAALRGSPAQKEAIYEALATLSSVAAERAVEIDFKFHRTIAIATNNPRFVIFLDHLGLDSVPRSRLQRETREDVSSDYLDSLTAEHHAIADAVWEGDASKAREAMRLHLNGGLERYKQLLGTTRNRSFVIQIDA